MLAPIAMTEMSWQGIFHDVLPCVAGRASARRLNPVSMRSRADALAKRVHVGADTCRVHSVVTPTLAAGGAHVDAASLLVDDDPDDDIVGEAEPPALLTRFDATCIDIGG